MCCPGGRGIRMGADGYGDDGFRSSVSPEKDAVYDPRCQGGEVHRGVIWQEWSRAEDRFQKNGEIAVSRGTGKTEFCAAGKFDRTSLPDYIINGLREIE